MQGKLNIFQRTMLQWNDMHPFNAVHVARIQGALDLERLRKAIRGTLQAHGLSGLRLDRRRGRYEYNFGEPHCEIVVLPKAENQQASLTAEITRQLNTGFAVAEHFVPFRFFVCADRDSFSLGLAYFHPVADAESVVALMKNILELYRGKGDQPVSNSLDLYPARRDRLLRHPGLLARKLISLPSHIKDIRTSCRPPLRNAQNMLNGLSFLSLGPNTLRSLSQAGKSWGVTLNDLFLALLMKCFSPLAAPRARGPRRRQISLGSIVNLRKDLNLDSRRTFGLFLGSFVVSHAVPNGLALPELAQNIRRQTERVKRDRLYLGTPLDLAVARRVFPLFSAERQRKFYPKNFPLWGGITNVNLNPLWGAAVEENPLDYFRAVSTGPVTPLVFSVTTVRDRINVALTYRTAVFSAGDVENLKCDFLDALSHLDARA